MTKKKSSPALPRYSEKHGWTGGDTRALYAFTDRRTGTVNVHPGGGARGKLLMHWGPEADVRLATRTEAEKHWQDPLHSGWKVAEGSSHATRKYSPNASDKIGKTMHEFKQGTLKSGGSGKKVKSRKQAIAIGISQARRAGYKAPPNPRGHATMSLDEKVRAHLSHMKPGQEIDAHGMARAIGADALAVDYALERAAKAGVAVTGDGRWYGTARRATRAHATRKSPAQLDKEIAAVLAPTLKLAEKKRQLKVLQAELDRARNALGYAGNTPAQVTKIHSLIETIQTQMRNL